MLITNTSHKKDSREIRQFSWPQGTTVIKMLLIFKYKHTCSSLQSFIYRVLASNFVMGRCDICGLDASTPQTSRCFGAIQTLSFWFIFIFTSLCGNTLASGHMVHTCSFNYKHPYIVSINIFSLLK